MCDVWNPGLQMQIGAYSAHVRQVLLFTPIASLQLKTNPTPVRGACAVNH